MKLFGESDRLYFKTLTSNDALSVLAFHKRNKPYFEPWESVRPATFYTEAYQRSTLTAEYNHILKSDFIRYYFFQKQYPDTIIGTISLSNIQYGVLQSCNLGYKIDHNFYRKGFATEAINWITSMAFQELKLHRIEAMVHIHNMASQKLLETLHFNFEGISKEYALLQEGFADHIRYVLLSSYSNST